MCLFPFLAFSHHLINDETVRCELQPGRVFLMVFSTRDSVHSQTPILGECGKINTRSVVSEKSDKCLQLYVAQLVLCILITDKGDAPVTDLPWRDSVSPNSLPIITSSLTSWSNLPWISQGEKLYFKLGPSCFFACTFCKMCSVWTQTNVAQRKTIYKFWDNYEVTTMWPK